jgi:hypothetical protein
VKIIGYIVCAYGLVYIAAGLYKLLFPPQPPIEQTFLTPTLAVVADVILALATLVEALTQAPEWLSACVVGVLLIGVGFLLVRRS